MKEKLEKSSTNINEFKQDMLFVLKELHLRKKLTEIEYYRAVTSVREGKY